MSTPASPSYPWWLRLSRLLTPQRLSYAWVAGGGLWLAWLISLILGPGNFDLAGQVIGTDYLQFYASGITLRQGQADRLYDFEYQAALEQQIAGPGLSSFHAFITPPFLAWLFVPLSSLPYAWSFILWSGSSLVLLWASLRFLGSARPGKTFLWSLCWYPVFTAVSFGQNSLLSLLLLSLTYRLWMRRQPFSAGLAASLVLFKPQLLLGVAILWLVDWRKDWKALMGLLTGGGALLALTLALMPEAASEYLSLAANFLPGLIYQEQFPLYHLHALRGFLILLLPGMTSLVEIVALIASLAAVVIFVRIIRRTSPQPAIQYAAAISLTILITPHAMIYDWALLLIPAILFWQNHPQLKLYWRSIFAILWVVTLLSGPLTYLQQKALPVVLQVSVPIYILVLVSMVKMLTQHGSAPDRKSNANPEPPNMQ